MEIVLDLGSRQITLIVILICRDPYNGNSTRTGVLANNTFDKPLGSDKQMFMTPHLDSYSTTDSKAGVLSAVMHHALCIMGHASYKHIYLKHFLGAASLVEAVGF